MEWSVSKNFELIWELNVKPDQSQSSGLIREPNVERDHSRGYSLEYGSRSPRVTSAWALILNKGAEAQLVKCNKTRAGALILFESRMSNMVVAGATVPNLKEGSQGIIYNVLQKPKLLLLLENQNERHDHS